MLAYVFWHRLRAGVSGADYERAPRTFHDRIGVTSAAYRLAALPFDRGGGYEDWYLVEDWTALGELNAAAVSDERRPPHAAAAALAGEGWGAVYALIRGLAAPPADARWIAKPAGRSYDEFVAGLDASSVWQRQMVLGPAAGFCLGDTAGAGGSGRVEVA